MAIKFIFDGKVVKQPGSYSTIKSAVKNPPLEASYGNILMIDTGTFGAGYGTGGAGIAGTLQSNIDAIHTFDNISDFRESVRGGLAWLLAKPLFQPNGFSTNGVSKLHYVKAASTVPAEITYIFGDNSISNNDGQTTGGKLEIQVRNEGVVGNGVLLDLVLTKGYGAKMRRSKVDTTKFVIDFYAGTFKGLDADLDPYDFFAESNCVPQLLLSSPQFDNISVLIDWMTNDYSFNQLFKLSSSDTEGTGDIEAADFAAYSGWNLAKNGAETYSTTYLDQVLDAVAELDYTFILSNDYGDSAQSSDNDKILTHLMTEAKYKKYLMVGGGKDRDKFQGTNSSVAIAQHFDSCRTIVAHAGVKKSISGKTGFKSYPAIYKAALVLGRIAGLEPQVPVTNKQLDMDGDLHPMNSKEMDIALDNGVLYTKADSDLGGFVVAYDINSIQNNANIINEDGTSYLISLERIKSQLDKEIIINSKITLLGQKNGVNRKTLSDVDLKQWLDGFLTSKTATDTQDNLILGARNIVVTRIGDGYIANYDFIPNLEISKLFFIGSVTEV